MCVTLPARRAAPDVIQEEPASIGSSNPESGGEETPSLNAASEETSGSPCCSYSDGGGWCLPLCACVSLVKSYFVGDILQSERVYY